MITDQKYRHSAYPAMLLAALLLVRCSFNAAAPLPSLPFTSIAQSQIDGSFTPAVSLISSQQDIDVLLAMQASESSIGAEERQYFLQAITAPYSDTVGILVGRDLGYTPEPGSQPPPIPKILAVQVINQTIQIVIEKPPTVTPCGMHPAWQFWKNHVCGGFVLIITGYHLIQISRKDIPPGNYRIHVIYPDGTTVADSTAVVAPPPRP